MDSEEGFTSLLESTQPSCISRWTSPTAGLKLRDLRAKDRGDLNLRFTSRLFSAGGFAKQVAPLKAIVFQWPLHASSKEAEVCGEHGEASGQAWQQVSGGAWRLQQPTAGVKFVVCEADALRVVFMSLQVAILESAVK